MTINGVVAPINNVTAQIEWANLFNTSFNAMDAHDHSPNNGVQIDAQSININSDFSCAHLSGFSYLNLIGPVVPIESSVMTDGVDLLTYDGLGRQIYITRDGVLNTATTTGGGFIGDYNSAGAQVVFTSVDNTYTFNNGAATLANLQVFGVSTTAFTLPLSVTVTDFNVFVPPSLVINFNLPATSAGVISLNGSFGIVSTPYLTCDATNTIATQINVASQFLSLMAPEQYGHITAKIAGVTKYNYYFYNSLTTILRLLSPGVSSASINITYPATNLVPFIEAALPQGVVMIPYGRTNAQAFIWSPPAEIRTTPTGQDSKQAAILVSLFATDGTGTPTLGGLGG